MHGPLEVNSDQELFRSFAVAVQRMAFYAGILQQNRFTIPLEDAQEYAHLLPQVLEVERRRLDSGGYLRRLTLDRCSVEFALDVWIDVWITVSNVL